MMILKNFFIGLKMLDECEIKFGNPVFLIYDDEDFKVVFTNL